MEEMAQVKNKVQNTYKYVFDLTQDKQKREDSANNMVVLAKERSGKITLRLVCFRSKFLPRRRLIIILSAVVLNDLSANS